MKFRITEIVHLGNIKIITVPPTYFIVYTFELIADSKCDWHYLVSTPDISRSSSPLLRSAASIVLYINIALSL